MNEEFPNIEDESVRQDILEILVAGGVVALPTDTLHGLSAAISYSNGLRRIAAMKGTPGRSQYILLASSIEMVERYVTSFGCIDRERLAGIWPGPLTAVLPAGPRCPEWFGDTVAFRVPDLPPLLELLDQLDQPVVSTSANRTGEAPIADPLEIKEQFGYSLDAIIAGPETPYKVCSTIVDFTGKSPEVIRQGDYEWADSG
ncbi:MAG: L-threonylcarbamoyladenylate synthase [Candidatus Latescibacterota bacterium]|jgi:tRNA threonylcarbamoyl adenosine modification protein (Sua5/YciO/YrdC/YwlC family)